MWIQNLTKNIIPAALAYVCPCGKRAGALSIIKRGNRACTDGKKGTATCTQRCGGNGINGKQQIFGYFARCNCSPQMSFTDLSVTAYMYCTHPAFKTPFTSLSVFRKFRRSQIGLPTPKFLSSLSQDQLVSKDQTEKKQFSFGSSSRKYYRSSCNKDKDMPSSTVELQKGESTTALNSPSKRKLSLSPEKSQKVLKEDQENKEFKMPTSVPSSPVIDSKVSFGSPLKSVNAIKSLGFDKVKLQFAKLSDKAYPPTKGSQYAAGYDLKSAYEYIVPKKGSCLVKTDIQIKLPRGTYGRVAPRSGLALKNKIDVGAGVIDEDYRGNVGVILFNFGDEDFHIAAGDRVAQLICEKIEYPEIEEVQTLDETQRGGGGFGSTGVKS